MDYETYITSAAWRERRRQFALHHPPKCPCGSRTRLELHHRTYERLGRELDEDLMWLCARCHRLAEVLIKRGVTDRADPYVVSGQRPMASPTALAEYGAAKATLKEHRREWLAVDAERARQRKLERKRQKRR